MSEWTRRFVLGTIVGIVGLVGVGIVGGLAVVYSGAVNVAASEEHASLTRWAFDTTFHNSVTQRAKQVTPPQRFTREMVERASTIRTAIASARRMPAAIVARLRCICR